MGLLQYLQRSIASLLQPWLLHKDLLVPVLLRLRFYQLVLELPFLEFDCCALNSSLFASSAFLLRNARLDHATLTISFFRSPGVFLELRGLHLVGSPRPREDSFWAARRRRSADEHKREAVSLLDPQGAAVHAAAERLAKGETSSSVYRLFWVSLALRAIRIELPDVAIELHSNSVSYRSHRCSLHSQFLTLEEGFPEGAGRTAGLFGAFIVGLVDALRRAEGPCDKICVVQNFCLRLAPSPGKLLPTSSGVEHLSQPLQDLSHLRTGTDSVNEHVSNQKSGCALFWKTVLLVTTFCDTQLDGMNADVAETKLQLNLADFDALLSIVSQLQGVPSKEIADYASYQESSKEPSRRNSRRGRYLWDKAVGRLVGGSWRRKLKYAVEARVLRHRYAQLYAFWLRETGWGVFNELPGLSGKKTIQGKKSVLKRLENELSLLEQELPVEAITLGRCVARCKVSTARGGGSITATFTKVGRWDDALSLLKPVFVALKRVWECLLFIFYSFHGLLCKGTKRILNSSRRSHVRQDESKHIVAKCSGYSYKGRETKSSKGWTSSFSSTFRRGSLVFAGLPDAPPGEDHIPSKEADKSAMGSIGLAILPAARFTWGNLCLAYQSNDDKLSLELLCGYVQGEMLSAIPTNIPEESADFYDTGQGSMLKGDNVVKFLESGPAPHLAISERAREFVKDGDFYGESLLGKNQFMASGVDAPAVDDDFSNKYRGGSARPFLLVDLESSQADTRALEISSGMLKCGLAVGRLDCTFDGTSFTHIAFLLMRFLEVLSVDRHSSKGEAYRHTVATGTAGPKQLKDNEWEASYAGWMKQYISAVVSKKKLWLTAAIQSPKLQLSGFCLDTQGTSSGTKGMLSGFHRGERFTLVMCLGLFEATVWPAQGEKNYLPAERVDKVSSSKKVWYDVKETKKWLRKPPSPHLCGDSMFETYSEHAQVGNNVILSIQGAALSLEVPGDNLESFPLVGPLKMTWECSLCRDRFVSIFHMTEIVSFAAAGLFSAITVNLYLHELEMLFEAGKGFLNASEQVSLSNNWSGFSHQSLPKIISTKPDDDQVHIQADGHSFASESRSLGTSLTSKLPLPLYFAVSAEVQIEDIDCRLGFQRNDTTLRSRQGNIDKDAIRSSREVQEAKTADNINVRDSRLSHNLDLIRKIVWIPCKDLCFQLSWGDGCQLYMSARCREAKVCVIKDGSQTPNNNERTNSFKISRDQKVKGTFVKSANSEVGRAHVLCELCIEQLSSCLKGPLHSSKPVNDTNIEEYSKPGGTHLLDLESTKIESVLGQNHVQSTPSIEESMVPTETRWLTADLEISKVQLTDCTLDRVITMASLRSTGTNSLCIQASFTKEFESISITSKGGMFVLHAQALYILLQQLQYLFVPARDMFSENARRDSSSTSIMDSSTFPPKLGKSSSLPLQNADKNVWKRQRLYSAPIRTCMVDQATNSRGFPWLTGGLSVEVGGLCVLLAQTNPPSDDKGGLLFELDVVAKSEGNVKQQTASLEITRFLMCSLQSAGRQFGRSGQGNQSIRFPKFGPSSTESVGLGVDKGLGPLNDISSPLKEVSPFCNSESQQLPLDSKNHELVSSSDSGDIGTGRVNDYILENLRISCRLENNFNKADFHPLPGSDGWKGTCSLMGIDIAVTTSEIKLLLALFSCFSDIAASYNPKSLKSSSIPQVKGLQQMYDHGGEIPDGSIVAVKDVREHLYMAVEKADNHYRLVGVLHYSLVGDRALFKVKYQKPGRNSSQSWFSLISVSAKNAHGEHFRVHFRPGSGLADIASTNDGSWELWQTISYTYSTKEDDVDIDIYGDLYNNLVYLVNQKSKQGLSLASGAPMMVKKPGSPFKFKILGLVGAMEGTLSQTDLQTWRNDDEVSEDLLSTSSIAIPKVDVKVGSIILTLLHETGGKHLLPLLRGRLEDAQAAMHVQSSKIRLMGGCKIILEYLEPHGNHWSTIMHPVDTEIFYRLRMAANEPTENQHTKMLTSLFARFKKVDIVIGETSLDVILFMIGALDLAGPYTMRHPPVLANSCLVENHTGLDLCCNFDNRTHKEVAKIAAWTTDSFLVRNMMSRRDSSPAKVSSSVALYLEKIGCGSSLPIHISLAEPGITAVRTRLENKEGHKKVAGPIIVVDVSKQSQDGITVSASPMVRIHNASGLPLELRCRRPKHDGEGAVVLLNDGDVIDDSMGAFDSMKLQGELRKALSSFNLGNFLLSIRPARVSLPDSSTRSHVEKLEQSIFDWSEDIKGEKARHVSGFLEKLEYGLRKSLKRRSLSFSFGTVHCRVRMKESNEDSVSVNVGGVHLCIRSTRRQVPMTSVNPQDKPQASRSVVAWQEQQELVILPTIRVYNLLELNISIILAAFTEDKEDGTYDNEVRIEPGGKAFMYAELTKLFFTVKIEDYSLTSKPVSIGDWKKNSQQDIATAPDDGLKEMEMELDFGDNERFGKLKVFRGDDGVLQILVYTQYAFKNNSDTALCCCAQKRPPSRWTGKVWWNEGNKTQWPPGEPGTCIHPGSKISWLERSYQLLLQLAEQKSEATLLDLESFSGSTELSIAVQNENSVTEQVHLGVAVNLPSAGELDPTHIIHFVSRFSVLNDSQEAVFVCQDGLQEDENAMILLNAGEHVAPRTLLSPGQEKIQFGQAHNVGSGVAEDSFFSLRFRMKEDGWDWSGPVCASALGSFSLRICRSPETNKDIRSHAARQNQPRFKFVAINVEEHSSSLIMRFCIQSADTVPYRIENALPRASLMYHQKGLSYSERLEPGLAVGYAWDNLSLSHKLVVQIAGTQFCKEINLDKLAPWKSFRAVPHNKGFGLQLPFHNQTESNQQYNSSGNVLPNAVGAMNVGYEVCAGGPYRVLRVCEDAQSSKQNQWQSHVSAPYARMDFKVPTLAITIVELTKQKNEAPHTQSTDDKIGFSPILCLRMSSMLLEFLNTEKHILFQQKIETLSVDEKRQGAAFAAMLRVHSQDRFKKGETVLHMAAVVSKHASNPNLVKYSSILLQAIDLNLDEETLMKLVPFYRYSLAESTSSRQIYFERFEIHPIKIVASFLPGQPLADYTSAQETLRALLHSFIKIPSVRGTTVELNGVLLSHALLTFRQLAIKCAQHYSWYAMRAIYIAKGSKLLPPAFASLFDDSAASSLDVFFDPSNGSIDLQGLTLGMFKLLSKGLNKRGYSGTSRYIGDLEHMMKTAGSNILYAVLTEVSDNVLKGAETGGFDGMVNGFRRGILNVAMEPSVLRGAVVKGGSSRRIKLDNSAGTDEMYIEGYLQAMLDALFKQDYLRVKVVDDQVLLKNLPPNSMLVDEIIACVKNFLVGEGLLAGETSTAAMHSLRRLQGEHERRLVPAVVALCEQLFVVFAVRALRNQAKSWFYWGFKGRLFNDKTSANQSDQQTITDAKHESESGQQTKRSINHVMGSFVLSSAMAYLDGRLCRRIPNTLARRIVSGFLLSFVE